MSYTYFGNHQGDWTASASYRARDTVINNNALYRALAPHTAGGTFVGDAAFWTKLTVTTEEIQDLVGAMVTGNTESGITVTYDDSGGKLDFSTSGGYTQEEIEDFVGAMVTGNTETNITVTYDDGTGKLNFVASGGGLTQEEVEDYVGAMVTGNTETGITVTYDDGAGKLDFAVATQLTTEQVQDIVGDMVSGNSETAISVTYDDTNGKLDFSVTPGSLDIDSFPAATTPLSSGDLFIVSQSGTEAKVAYSDVTTGASSDPYGLLVTPGGAVWGDEFDDASIDGAWTNIAPGAGTTTWTEGNHMLTAVTLSVADTGAAAKVRSIAGTAWASGTILETEIGQGIFPSPVGRIVFFVSDGATGASNSVGLMCLDRFYTVRGTIASPFGTSNAGPFGYWLAGRLRLRIRATTADEIKFFASSDGISWADLTSLGGAAYSIATLGWTPTHVGLGVMNGGGTVEANLSSDYVRRIA